MPLKCFDVSISGMWYLLHKVGVRLTEKPYCVASIPLLPRPFSGFHMVPEAHSTFTLSYIKTLQCLLCASACIGCWSLGRCKSDTAPALRLEGRSSRGHKGHSRTSALDFIFLKLITTLLPAEKMFKKQLLFIFKNLIFRRFLKSEYFTASKAHLLALSPRSWGGRRLL